MSVKFRHGRLRCKVIRKSIVAKTRRALFVQFPCFELSRIIRCNERRDERSVLRLNIDILWDGNSRWTCISVFFRYFLATS